MSSKRRNYTVWPTVSIDWAMSLKGTMSVRAAERETGIPASTIRGWWSGRSDPYRGPGLQCGTELPKHTHCRRGHKYKPSTIRHHVNGRRECKICYRESQRRAYYRRKKLFHPVLNPDVELAPIEHLWFHGPSLLEELYETMTYSELYQQLDPASQRRLGEIKRGFSTWVRYNIADRICLHVGHPVSALRLQPVYTPHPNALKEAA